MEKLFSYGTLQDLKIQKEVLGRTLAGQPDTLADFKAIIDKGYPRVIPEAGQRTNGILYSLTADDLASTDEYEGHEYKRIQVKLSSGATAWVYI